MTNKTLAIISLILFVLLMVTCSREPRIKTKYITKVEKQLVQKIDTLYEKKEILKLKILHDAPIIDTFYQRVEISKIAHDTLRIIENQDSLINYLNISFNDCKNIVNDQDSIIMLKDLIIENKDDRLKIEKRKKYKWGFFGIAIGGITSLILLK